ncbi:MAG: response regulator [Sulfitobacter sp.]
MTNKPIKNAMIIDDEVFDQRIYKRIIARSGLVENLHSFLAADLALDYLSGHPDMVVDAIFLDINMPRMNGFEFLDQATAMLGPNFAKVCIVMLTTSLDPKDMQRAKEFEVVKEFLNKPLTTDHVAHVADLVSQANDQA